jgi:hypothetical protein
VIKQAIRRAEWEFSMLNFEKDVEQKMIEAGWSIDFIYLDQNLNRFQL